MRAAFIVIGLVFVIGGAAALARPGSMTLSPSGSKWRHSVEVSADGKKAYGYFAVVLGAGFLLAGALRCSSQTKKEDVGGVPR
jgi:hypothetical protein